MDDDDNNNNNNNNNPISSNGVLQLVVATWTSQISFSWNSRLTV